MTRARGNPFKTKYETSRAYFSPKTGAPLPFFELRGLKDGNLRRQTDDGPHDNIKKTAQSGRANALAMMAKRMPDPLSPDGDEIPIFVFDGDGPLPKIYDTRINAWVSPARMNDHYREVMAFMKGQRDENARSAEERAAEQKKATEDQLAAGAALTLKHLGEQAAKMNAAPAKAEPEKPTAKNVAPAVTTPKTGGAA